MTRKRSKEAAVQAMADAIEREAYWPGLFAATYEQKQLSYLCAAISALRVLRRFARVEMRELPKRKGKR